MEEPRYSLGGLDTQEAVLAYVQRHPLDLALVCAGSAEGGHEPTEVVVERNADEPVPLASTMKIAVLAAHDAEAPENLLRTTGVRPSPCPA